MQHTSEFYHHLLAQLPLPSELDEDDLGAGPGSLGDELFFLSSFPALEQTSSGNIDYPEMEGSDTIYAGREVAMSSMPPATSSTSKTDLPQKRKRSPIACQACHDKRIRCDAAARGLPCSNCRFRDTDCILIDSKRSRCVYYLFNPKHICGLLFSDTRHNYTALVVPELRIGTAMPLAKMSSLHPRLSHRINCSVAIQKKIRHGLDLSVQW